MKFRNPKTGEVFEDITRAFNSFCSGRACVSSDSTKNCPFAYEVGRCDSVAKLHPEEATRRMGYEVVEDEADNHIAAPGKKALKDWTLGEVRDYCEGRPCDDCHFGIGSEPRCKLTGSPSCWDLTEKPRWTEQEIKDAKIIKAMVRGATNLKITETTGLCVECEGGLVFLDGSLFPSLNPGEKVNLNDIIKTEMDQ